MKFGKTGETYHFSNNDYYSIKDIILLICKIKKFHLISWFIILKIELEKIRITI